MSITKKTALFLFPFFLLGTIFLFGPRVSIDEEIRFNPSVIGSDVDLYLAREEAKIPGIRPGLQKQVVWANGKKGEKSPISFVYIHGFSSSSGELRPLPDEIASKWNANIFFTRLQGHGRDGQAMAQASVNGWINDYEEALEIGRKIGEKVIVIGTSTGGSLLTWRAATQPYPENIAGYILFSPNFGIQATGSSLLLLPWGKQVLKIMLGDEYKSSRTLTPLYKKNWTPQFPSIALLQAAAAAKIAGNAPVENIKIPGLFIFSQKDKVVQPELIFSTALRWGSTHDMFILSHSGDPFMHILSGATISPSTIPFLTECITSWLQTILPNTPLQKTEHSPS